MQCLLLGLEAGVVKVEVLPTAAMYFWLTGEQGSSPVPGLAAVPLQILQTYA